MLEKLAAIADLADQQGYHEAASDLTQLIKTAQLFDALKTLFDPSTSELGPDSNWWKRLTRGWSRGKFDRRLGLALAINAERTKLNKKIEMLAQPLKDFSAQVSGFYDKVKSGGDNYGAMDFKSELSQLKSDAAKMKNLIGGKDLRKALDLRNKLNVQQISAVEKIKGIDPEHKDFLINLLNGNIKKTPEGKPENKDVGKDTARPSTWPTAEEWAARGVNAPITVVPEAVPGQQDGSVAAGRTKEQKAISDWLKLQDIARRPYDDGFKTSRSAKRAAIIYQRYGFNPFAVLEFFKNNPSKREEGVELFGYHFRKLFDDLDFGVELEKAKSPEVAKEVNKEVKEVAKEVAKEEVAAPASVPAAVAPASVEKKPSAPATKKPSELELDKEMARTHDKKEKAEEARAVARKKKVEPKPEEKTPRPPITDIPLVSPASDLAVSTATRTSREITRLGRIQQLRKLSQEE